MFAVKVWTLLHYVLLLWFRGLKGAAPDEHVFLITHQQWPSAGSTVGQRRRRYTIVDPALGHGLVSAGLVDRWLCKIPAGHIS